MDRSHHGHYNFLRPSAYWDRSASGACPSGFGPCLRSSGFTRVGSQARAHRGILTLRAHRVRGPHLRAGQADLHLHPFKLSLSAHVCCRPRGAPRTATAGLLRRRTNDPRVLTRVAMDVESVATDCFWANKDWLLTPPASPGVQTLQIVSPRAQTIV